MSKYTTEVRFICENAYGLEESKGVDSVNTIVNSAAVQSAIFQNFPIFDEEYRPILQAKILKHYYTQEIGEETVGLWKLRLDTRMNEIMPYYNQLYESELIEFNPMYTADYTRSGNRSGATNDSGNENRTAGGADTRTDAETNVRNAEGNRVTTNQNTSEVTREAGQWDLYSDTPQGGIDGILAAQGTLAGNGFLTNARHTYGDGNTDTTENNGSDITDTEDTSTETRNGTSRQDYGRTDSATSQHAGTSTEQYIEHIVGFQGRGPSAALMEFRETFLNIDMMIINDLQDLFMGVW